LRLEKAIAVSLAIHLLAAGCVAIGSGIKRCSRKPAPDAVFAELLPPSPAPVPNIAHRLPDQLTENPKPAQAAEATAPESPVATPVAAPVASSVPPLASVAAPAPVAAPPAESAADAPAATAALATSPGTPVDNAAGVSPDVRPDPFPAGNDHLRRVAMISTAAFFRDAPGELSRVVNAVMVGGTLMSQGDAFIHMDVDQFGQVTQAHIEQVNSKALFHRLERIDWTTALPPRPLVACNAIHLRISVVGNDIRVNVEFL
jgi:hypothetical protein